VEAAGHPVKVLGGLFTTPHLDELYGRRILIRGIPVTNYSPTGKPLNVRFYAVGIPDVTVLDPPLAHPAPAVPEAAGAAPLTRIAQVKALLNADAERRYPVHLRAVVTRRDPRNHDVVIQDATAAVYTSRPPGVVTPPMRLGDLLEIEGVTRRSGYAPLVEIHKLRVVAHPGLPRPRKVNPAEGFAGADENAWVEVRGIVHSVRPGTAAGSQFELVSGSRRVLAVYADSPPAAELAALVGRTVRVRGVWGPLFTGDESLTGVIVDVPAPEFVEILPASAGDSFDSPARPIHSLLEYIPGELPRHPVHLRGRITYASEDDFAYLADASGGVRVDGGHFTTGESVDLLGFSSFGRARGGIELVSSRPAPVSIPEPAPERVAVETVNFGVYDGRLLTIEAYVCRRVTAMGDQTLTVRSGGQEFTAVYEHSQPVDGWEELREGALVRLTGVCQIDWNDRALPAVPHTLRILLRTPRDVELLGRPPWWTAGRLGTILGVTLLASVLILAWVAALRRRVRTELQRRAALEAQLLQAQKLESIGRLAGGVAHDFNNLLTVISGYTQLLRQRLRDDTELASYVEEINKVGERGAALTQQLLAFSRNQRLKPVVFDVNALVGEMETMLRRLIGDGVEIRLALDPLPCRVLADPDQMGQVLMNLAVNARDAMPGGGRLAVQTRHLELDGRAAAQHGGVAAGRYVEITVADTGSGMNDEVRARVFEPFYTTKGRGHGTGLGLATVFGIVKQSGGHIWVDSEPGHGATFRIVLPAHDAVVAVAPVDGTQKAG
jgi:signal transduction histidine kinase